MLLLCIFVFINPIFCHQPDPYQPDSPYVDMVFESNEENNLNAADDPPLILWWTGDLYPHRGEENTDRIASINCDGTSCLSSADITYLSDSRTRAVMFYGTNVEPHNLPLPRKKTHEWCLYHEESPMNNFLLSQEAFIRLFNHTATFRRESDYPLTTQNIYGQKFLFDRKPVSLAEKNRIKIAKNLAPVMYVQSHENVPSDRDTYVKELMKYIKVDSYGSQLHNRDLPEELRDPAESFEREDFLDFISIYKFHLAFENGVCKDYMTEKLMRPLYVGSVPIYYGSPVAQDWMPNNSSVIMVNDFTSPKELAKYIKYLDNNDEEYDKYLAYKKPGGVTNEMLVNHIKNRPWGSHDFHFHRFNEEMKPDSFAGFECHVCQQISKRIQKEKHHLKDPSIPLMPPKMANNSHMGCPEPFSSLSGANSSPNPKQSRHGRINWIQTYRQQKEIAEIVNKILLLKETDSTKFHEYMTAVRTEGRYKIDFQ